MTKSSADAHRWVPLRVRLPHAGTRRRIIAIARVLIGLDFASEAVRKISQSWLVSGSDFVHTIQAYPAAHSGGFYHAFVTGTLLPHARLFAVLVTLGECLVAVSLTLGLFTRVGALTALWLNLNFMLLRGLTNPSGTIDRVFILANLLFLVTAAGCTWGLDGRFRTTFSRIPVARWFAGGSGLARTPAPVGRKASLR
jgi:uncharacterized membrane protein YphA (DoxX/SURF4 family)